MKKLLLSFAALAMGFSVMAQSGNSIGSDYVIYNFNGTSDDNCGTVISGVQDAYAPDSKLNNANYSTYSYNGTQLEVDKNDTDGSVATNAWQKLVFQFAMADCSAPATVNLSASTAHYMKITINSSVAVPQMMIFFRQGSNYNDNNPWQTSLVAGDNVITFNTPIDWGIYGSTNKLDSTIVDGFGIAFRTAWNDNTPQVATLKIDQIEIGNYAATAVTAPAVLPSDVKYYPNPATSIINVENTNVSSLKLMNVNGSVVKESTTSSISVEGLTSGMYFLQINNYKPVKVAVK